MCIVFQVMTHFGLLVVLKPVLEFFQYSIAFEFADGTLMNHSGSHLSYGFTVRAVAVGLDGSAEIGYTGKAFVNGGSAPYAGGDVSSSLYTVGALSNIMTFYKNVTGGDFSNPTVEPSVNSTLATILGREAALRRERLTMEALITENRRIEVLLVQEAQ